MKLYIFCSNRTWIEALKLILKSGMFHNLPQYIWCNSIQNIQKGGVSVREREIVSVCVREREHYDNLCQPNSQYKQIFTIRVIRQHANKVWSAKNKLNVHSVKRKILAPTLLLSKHWFALHLSHAKKRRYPL